MGRTVALGAAWWLLADGLSAEERRLVGTWLASPPAAAAYQRSLKKLDTSRQLRK